MVRLFSAVLVLSVFPAPPVFAGSFLQLIAHYPEPKAISSVPAPAAAEDRGVCVFSSVSGQVLSGQDALAGAVKDAAVVYVGETHDQAADHQAQLAALEALYALRGNGAAVGFEMLNASLQPVLDEYVSGRIDQEEFLEKTAWKKEWGFDFGLYKPLFDFAIRHKLRALALNVPKRIISKIGRFGLGSLTPEERAFLPETVAITAHKEYLAYLKENYESMHAAAPGTMPAITWENYLAAMCAWNEGMGSRIADFLNADPARTVMTIAGNGHIAYNAAIPASVASRVKGIRQASFHTEGAALCPAAVPAGLLGRADYIWFTPR